MNAMTKPLILGPQFQDIVSARSTQMSLQGAVFFGMMGGTIAAGMFSSFYGVGGLILGFPDPFLLCPLALPAVLTGGGLGAIFGMLLWGRLGTVVGTRLYRHSRNIPPLAGGAAPILASGRVTYLKTPARGTWSTGVLYLVDDALWFHPDQAGGDQQRWLLSSLTQCGCGETMALTFGRRPVELGLQDGATLAFLTHAAPEWTSAIQSQLRTL